MAGCGVYINQEALSLVVNQRAKIGIAVHSPELIGGTHLENAPGVSMIMTDMYTLACCYK
jgi:hypothetical protein